MLALILAGFCLLLRGSLSLGWVLGAGEEFDSSVWIEALVAATVGFVLFVGLLCRIKGMWWTSVIFATVYTLLGAGVLSVGHIADFWQVSADPREMIIFFGVATALSALALCLLMFPGARAAWQHPSAGNATADPFSWMPIVVCASALGGAALLTWHTLERYPVLIHDEARILKGEARSRIARYHGLLRQDFDIDYRVITGRDLGDLDCFAAQRFRTLEIGSVSDQGRGLLLVIDVAADQVRLEVGYALEPTFVDAFMAYIQKRQMTEFFAAGRLADGMLATTEMIVMRARNAAENAGFAGEAWIGGSGGAGARAKARIDAGDMEARSNREASAPAENTPRQVLEAYRSAMQERNDNPNLAFYSAATRRMMRDWVVTPAQMDSVARSLADCAIESRKQRGNRAVLRSAYDARQCPPYFFLRENGRWALNLAPMKSMTGFNHRNQWHLNLRAVADYSFAFADWIFDPNGFPVARVNNERLLERIKSKTRPPLLGPVNTI